MRPLEAGGTAWYVILLEGQDERRWFPETLLTDFTAESGGVVPAEVEKGAKLAHYLIPLSHRGRVAEFIRIRRLQETTKISQKASNISCIFFLHFMYKKPQNRLEWINVFGAIQFF
jgi:hypothetical protein